MIGSIVRVGWNRVVRNKRLVLAAWLVNLVIALIVVIPFHRQLESTLTPTIHDERMLERMDETWLQMYGVRMETDPSQPWLLSYSILGAGPFIHHLNGMLSGRVVTSIDSFVWDSITQIRVASSRINMLTILALLWSIAGLFFSGGFISVYASTVRASIPDFVAESARSFGRVFRVGLIGFVFASVLVAVVNPWITYRWIGQYTLNDATEMPAFILLLAKNAMMLFLLWFGGFVLDYARIRIVLEARTSALIASWAGLKYCLHYWRITVSIALVMAFISAVVVLVVGVFLESVNTTTAGTIAVVFVVQQLYLVVRQGLKAMTYASAVEIFRTHPARDAYPFRFEL